VEGTERHGFQRLIAEIGLGNAGLVLSLDASRLACNNRDWHQLLDLCSLFGVVLADGERLYDPGAYPAGRVRLLCCTSTVWARRIA
jgi:DNA invertase Pin-like site-specific DNA recombinase